MTCALPTEAVDDPLTPMADDRVLARVNWVVAQGVRLPIGENAVIRGLGSRKRTLGVWETNRAHPFNFLTFGILRQPMSATPQVARSGALRRFHTVLFVDKCEKSMEGASGVLV